MSKNTTLMIVSACLLIFFSVADLIIGSTHIPFKELIKIFSEYDPESKYFRLLSEYRLPKMITAILTGASLSVAGLQMQTVFRNPLAGPYVLGISTGAGLGVALVMLSPFAGYFGTLIGLSWITSIFAWIGAAGVLLIIFTVSLRVKDVMTILIIGVLFGSAVSAVISVMQYFGEQASLKTYVIWTMGSLGGINKEQLIVFAPVIIIGLLTAYISSGMLNILLLGENYAKTSGLKILRARIIIFASTSILTGTVTAFCGPIGFIGIIVPHLARMLFKTAEHKILIPASALIGAIFILISDMISQLPGYHGTLPLNTITAIAGIPIMIHIILKSRL